MDEHQIAQLTLTPLVDCFKEQIAKAEQALEGNAKMAQVVALDGMLGERIRSAASTSSRLRSEKDARERATSFTLEQVKEFIQRMVGALEGLGFQEAASRLARMASRELGYDGGVQPAFIDGEAIYAQMLYHTIGDGSPYLPVEFSDGSVRAVHVEQLLDDPEDEPTYHPEPKGGVE